MANLPTFNTIPEAQMAKPKPGSGTSQEQKAIQSWFDKVVTDLKPGQACVIPLDEGGMGSKSIRMNLRHAANRTKREVVKYVITDKDVQFTVRPV